MLCALYRQSTQTFGYLSKARGLGRFREEEVLGIGQRNFPAACSERKSAITITSGALICSGTGAKIIAAPQMAIKPTGSLVSQ